MAQQFDNLVRPMDFITINLVSSRNIIHSMNTLSNIPRGVAGNDIFISQASGSIYSALGNDAINRNFFSVNVFNDVGDLFVSNIQTPSIRATADNIAQVFPWMHAASELHENILLIPPRPDPWREFYREEVFSLVRTIHWGGRYIGFIEVQHLIDELENVFSVPDSVGLKVALVSAYGEIFYQTGFATNQEAAWFIEADNSQDFLYLTHSAPFTDFTLYVFQDRQTLMEPLTNTLRLGGVMMFVLLALSIIFAIALNRQIIKPIWTLRSQMENVELETLQDAMPIESPVNDIAALEKTFALMRERLSDAVTSKLRSQELQMQANYDALQLQINPHFFYNVLNVVSQKGMDSENDEICEICADLASMMRYSTSTMQRTATVSEEVEHVKTYVSLMQKRYEGRISFDVDVAASVEAYEVPKIILQQFVENAINHNFAAGSKEIDIKINCSEIKNGCTISITDNGIGFSQDVLAKLLADISELRNKLHSQSTEFEIGGMGLRNTYARLLLFFGDRLDFALGNNEHGGAFVTIGIREGN